MSLPIGDIRQGIFQDLFGTAIKEKGRVNLIYARLNVRPEEIFQADPDRLGPQQSRGAVSAAGQITDLYYSAFSGTERGVTKLGQGRMGGSTVRAFMGDANRLGQFTTYDTESRQNVVVAWDAYTLRLMSQRGLSGSPANGTQRSGFVDVKKIARTVFDDLGDWNDNIGSIPKFRENVGRQLEGNIERGSSLSYIKQSLEAQGKSLSDLTDDELTESVFNAAYLKAKAEGRLGQIRQMMYQGGVRNLDNIIKTIEDPVDPLGIANKFSSSVKSGKGAFYSGGYGSNLPGFIKSVSEVSGEEYAYEQLMPFMNKLYQDDKLKGLSFMLTDQGELYAGQGQVWNTYKPIPLEVLGARSIRDEAGKVTGYTGDVSMRGLPRGMMIIGESNRIAKKQIVDNKAVPASQVALDAFAQGALEPYQGLKEGNIEVALATGFNRARKSWDPLLSATISRGMPSTIGSLATSYSAHDPSAYSEFREAIVGIAGDVGAMRDISVNRQKMFDSIARYRSAAGVSDEHAFVKPKDFSVPLEGIEDFAFPGSLTSTEQKKGVYHRLKPAEITDPQHIARIKAGLSELYNGTVSPNSVGQFAGDYRALVAGQESLQGLLGERTGRQGSQLVTKFTFPTLYLSSDSPSVDKFRQQRVVFGEPTIETTAVGREMFEDILRPTTTYDAKMSRGKLENFLNAISDTGDYRDVEGLDQIFKSLTGEGPKGKTREHFGQGIEIDSAARKRLRSAGFKIPRTDGNYQEKHTLLLNYASYQEWDKQAHFGFMTRTTPGSFSLVHAGQRVTALNPIESRFSEFNEYAAAVTGVETLAGQNRVNSMFSHRTGITQLLPGGPEAFASHYKTVAEEFNAKAGSTVYDPELIQFKTDKEGAGYLVPKAGAQENAPEQFEAVSREALKRMGASRGAIEGKAKAIARLRGLDPSVFSNNDKLLYDQSMMRIGETELITNQAKGLRPRLEILRRIGRGSIGYSGIKPKDNPAFMEMAMAWEESTGFRFSKQFMETGVHGVGSLIDYGTGPQGTHLKAISSLLKGPEAVKQFSKTSNIPIISADEAYKLFVSGEHGVSIAAETGQEGILTSKLTNSALFSNEYRPENMRRGVFVDIGSEQIAPLHGAAKGANKPEAFVTSRYLFVPGTDSSLKKFWHVSSEEPDIPQRLPIESLERNVLGTLSSLKNKPGEQGVTKGTLQGYFADTYRALARYTTPQGKIKQAAHVGKSMKDAARFRLVPRADITDSASIAKSLEPTEDMFTVGISKGDLRKVVGNKNYKRALASIEKEGFVYGGMFPNPAHAGQHLSVVKYKLMESLADVGEAEPRAMVEGFLAWKMNRDNDQDTIQGFFKRRFKDQAKWEDAFKEQLKASMPEYRQYRLEVEQAYKDATASGLNETMETFLPKFIEQHKANSLQANRIANKLKYMSFGSTPPISFAGEWSSFSLASAFASNEGDNTIAIQLNKMLRGLNAFKDNSSFSSGDIARYRAALGPNPQEAFSVATLLQQNMLQGFISKGGAYQDAMFEFENLPYRIAQGVDSGNMSLEQAREESIRSVRTLFDLMAGGKDGPSKLRLPGKKFVDLADDEARQLAAETLGSVYGVGLYAHAEKITPKARRSGNFDPVRIAEKSKEGNLQNLAMSQGEAIEASRIGTGLIPTSQRMVADANKATKNKGAAGAESKAGSETLKKAGSWLKDNWKLVAAGAGALIGLRALNNAFGDEEVKRPSLKSSAALAFGNAPLPPEPMVGRNEDGPQIQRQQAYVQPPNSQYSSTRYNGSFSSVNSNELMSAIRVSPFAASQGTVNLVDSRSYKSNWELQSIADQAGNSDFIYNGMGIV